MTPEEVAEIIENALGLKAAVEGNEVVITDGKEEVRAPADYTLASIAMWVEPRKAWSVIRILYGDKAQGRKAYEEYKELPYTTTGKVCWLHKALAKAVNQRLKGADKERVLGWLEDQVYRRWPNVCGEVDALPDASKLVTLLNEKGVSASLNLVDKDIELKIRGYPIRLKRRSPKTQKLLKELRKLAKENHETLIELMPLLSGSAKSCIDVARAIVYRDELKEYPMIRNILLEFAENLSKEIITRLKEVPE